jgi:hypothetical protein
MSETPDQTTEATKPVFLWTPSTTGGGVILRPWLTNREQVIVQKLFDTKLTFAPAEDDVLGSGTMIYPRIAEANRPAVESELIKVWYREGTNISQRQRYRQALAPSPVKAAAVKTTTVAKPPIKVAPKSKPEPQIVFAPSAFLKYLYMCHAHGAHTEVGGYGVHRMAPGNVIYIYKFMTVRQDVTPTFCSLDVNHANELLMQLCSADEHFNPNHLLACWCHTHPGFSITPSAVDWNTFDDIDSPDWAAMIILNKKLEMGAHVRQRGPLYSPVRKVDVSVDWERLPDCLDEIRRDDWEAEYMTNVWPSAQRHQPGYHALGKGDHWGDWSDWDTGQLVAPGLGHGGDDDDLRRDLKDAGYTSAEIDDEVRLQEGGERFDNVYQLYNHRIGTPTKE